MVLRMQLWDRSTRRQYSAPPGKQLHCCRSTPTAFQSGEPFEFGQNYQTFEEEGISGNRVIRLKGQIPSKKIARFRNPEWDAPTCPDFFCPQNSSET